MLQNILLHEVFRVTKVCRPSRHCIFHCIYFILPEYFFKFMFSPTFLNEGQKLYDSTEQTRFCRLVHLIHQITFVFALDSTSVILHSHMEGISVLA